MILKFKGLQLFMKDLTVAGIQVRQDSEGRYCLNDLHKAAGGESKHQPANFLRLDNTKALIDEIDRSSDMRNAIDVKQGGVNQGTYAAKELVYSYAMWISAKFNLQVIRAYDAVVAQPVQVAEIEKAGIPAIQSKQGLGSRNSQSGKSHSGTKSSLWHLCSESLIVIWLGVYDNAKPFTPTNKLFCFLSGTRQ